MHEGEGNWIVVMKLPDLRNRTMGRYRTRGEAEHIKERIARFSGNRFPLHVVFDPQPNVMQQDLFKRDHITCTPE